MGRRLVRLELHQAVRVVHHSHGTIASPVDHQISSYSGFPHGLIFRGGGAPTRSRVSDFILPGKLLNRINDIRPEILQADHTFHGLNDLSGGLQAGTTGAPVDLHDIAAINPDAAGQFFWNLDLHG